MSWQSNHLVLWIAAPVKNWMKEKGQLTDQQLLFTVCRPTTETPEHTSGGATVAKFAQGSIEETSQCNQL